MDGSHALVEMLKAHGVDVIFGVPGDACIPFWPLPNGWQHRLC